MSPVKLPTAGEMLNTFISQITSSYPDGMNKPVTGEDLLAWMHTLLILSRAVQEAEEGGNHGIRRG